MLALRGPLLASLSSGLNRRERRTGDDDDRALAQPSWELILGVYWFFEMA